MNFDIYLIGRTYKKGNVYYLKYGLICRLILFDCMYQFYQVCGCLFVISVYCPSLSCSSW